MQPTFRTAVLCIGLIAAVLAGPAFAQVLEDRQYRVEFTAGKSGITLSDTLTGGERVIYRLGARAGQTLDVRLSSTTRLVEFAIYDPKAWPDGRPIATSSLVGALVPELNRHFGTLGTSGDYRIVVRHLRDFARPGTRSDFRLEVAITGGAAQGSITQLPAPPAGVGGAAFVKVVGVAAGDHLNMRAGPGANFRVVERIAPGTVLRSQGCEPSGAPQWCKVNRPARPAVAGWVSARFLAASAPPQDQGVATQLPGGVPGGDYSSTGSLACQIAGRPAFCQFGVIRRGRGNATLDVTLPSGARRTIVFEGGRPVSNNSPAGIYGEWTATGAVIVMVGTNERYTVEEAVLFGG